MAPEGLAALMKCAVLLALLTLSANAQVTEQVDPAPVGDGPIAIEVFKGPTPKDVTPPHYPFNERGQGNEGWVNVNFMIDPQGKPYELIITDSIGGEAFQRAALKAVEGWTFEPASIGGKPIHAGHNYKLRFVLTDSGASPIFVRAYRSLIRAITAGDRVRADEQLAKLKVSNLYEDAFSNLARYNYYRKWGTEAQQLAALRLAIAEESSPRYLPKDMFAAALQFLLPLELRAEDFWNATKTWEKLQKARVDAASIARWKATLDDVEKLRKDARAYGVPGEIEKGSSWFYRLYKHRFQVAVSSGRVSEVKLRCDKQYVFFRFDPDMQYNINEKYGECSIELVGELGTKFELIQS